MEKAEIFERFTRAPAGGRKILGKRSGWKAACAVFLLCAAMPIASSAQTFTTLANFDGKNGKEPRGALVQGRDGNFYGTTFLGGAIGTVFKITPAGTLAVLHNFAPPDGFEPYAALVQATDGNFYGTTWVGGATSYGTVFKITPAGSLTTLHSFDQTDGELPFGMVQATDGNFYGTAEVGGGPYDGGTVFKITPSGTLTALHSFDGTDGGTPSDGLVQATDGNFYGATFWGGTYDYGTVFKITPAGSLTTLHSFDQTDGAHPSAGPVQATDGNFYGTTNGGGTYDVGTVFRITPSGTLTTLHSFHGTDGANPYSGLVQATDGNFYGITYYGGNHGNCPGGGCGTVFKITPSGTLTTLHGFDRTDGSHPWAALVQATNGVFYGTTSTGGAHNDGTVFSLDMGLGPFVAFVRNSGKVGASVQILGQGFTGTTAVSFNGTPATFRVVSDTFLRAIVPAGATTGYVTMTTPSATLTSNVQFRVRP